MNKRAEYLLHTKSEVERDIELLKGYLEWLEQEFEKEVEGNK